MAAVTPSQVTESSGANTLSAQLQKVHQWYILLFSLLRVHVAENCMSLRGIQ